MSKELTPKERKAEYDREYRKRNKERIAEYKRAWIRKNSLRVSEQRHEYYMKRKKEKQMKGKEIKYAIAFDENKEFKEIRIMDDQSEPSAAWQGSVYVLSQREFKKLMESAMRCYTEPAGANDEKEEIEQDGGPLSKNQG